MIKSVIADPTRIAQAPFHAYSHLAIAYRTSWELWAWEHRRRS